MQWWRSEAGTGYEECQMQMGIWRLQSSWLCIHSPHHRCHKAAIDRMWFLRCKAAAEWRFLCKIAEHKHKMTQAAGHDEQMKNFMQAEHRMPCVKQRQPERVDNAACSIDQSAGEQP